MCYDWYASAKLFYKTFRLVTSKELFNKNTLLLLIVLQATTAVGDLTICLIEIKLTNILQVQGKGEIYDYENTIPGKRYYS